MSALPQVTLVGEPSSGALSDVLEKSLPNGWEIDLSNEIYLDYLGHNYEVSGVAVGINIPAFFLSDIKRSKDSALGAVINRASQQYHSQTFDPIPRARPINNARGFLKRLIYV